MAVTSLETDFFQHLRTCTQPVLLLDYDGTLAPFTVERSKAQPYPGVVETLQDVLRSTSTRVMFVSGRGAHDLASILKPYDLNCEIWGMHGGECLRPDGTCQNFETDPQVSIWLKQAEQILRAQGMDKLVELKPGALAVHWRGLDAAGQDAARRAAQNAFAFLRTKTDCRVMEFDGGIEMIAGGRNKGDVVRTVMGETSDPSAIAYLGDDVTDEDAFLALRETGLTVLVRPEYRSSHAEIWIKPPEELIGFLKDWSRACGGRA